MSPGFLPVPVGGRERRPSATTAPKTLPEFTLGFPHPTVSTPQFPPHSFHPTVSTPQFPPHSFHPTPPYPLPSLHPANLPQWYEIITDTRHKKPRLNLYQFDGAPANPLYLEYRPPQMLPTTAFHSTRPTDNENKKGRRKRDIGYEAIRNIRGVEKMGSVKEEWLVVLGVGMTALGGVGFFWF
jgi:hypothetical protein